MNSRKLLSVLGIVVWSTVVLTAWPHSMPRHSSFLIKTAKGELTASCSDLHIRFSDDREAMIQSEERTISKAEAPTLRVTAETNGGIQVQGWDSDTYSVTLCKAAETRDALSHIHMSFENGDLGVTGPSSRDRWSAHFLIRAPKAAALELSAQNGPLSVYNVDGRLKIRAENGPVTVRGCSGELDLAAQNGPLTLENNSGKQTARIQNGPVTVTLSGNSWDGAGLVAQATNGPVRLEIPSGYRSGVVLESAGRGPFDCNAMVCSEGRKTWDDDHKRIEFGSGPAVVRVSTVNGPISVN
jgi:hypothetical protein